MRTEGVRWTESRLQVDSRVHAHVVKFGKRTALRGQRLRSYGFKSRREHQGPIVILDSTSLWQSEREGSIPSRSTMLV